LSRVLLKVVSKDSGKIIIEHEYPEESIDQVINELMIMSFDPKYFDFVKEKVREVASWTEI